MGSGLWMYLGVLLGFVNAFLLFPKILGQEAFGFCQFLLQSSQMVATIGLLGLPNVMVHFFPRFQDRSNQHGGYPALFAFLGGWGTLLVVIVLLIFRPTVLHLFGGEGDTYLRNFYWALLILSIATAVVRLLGSYLTALKQPRVSVFWQQVGIRMITTLLLIAFFFEWIDLPVFLWLFALQMVIAACALIFHIYRIGEWHTRVDWNIHRQPDFPEMLRYGGYAFFALSGSVLINRIDTIMLSGMLAWKDVGIYAVFYALAMVIPVLHHGIAEIAHPTFAEHWANNRRKEISRLYRRAALNNTVPGVLLYVGILANLENAVALLGEDYRPGIWVAVYLGGAQLIHILNGYNGLILIHSRHYHLDLPIRLLTVLITIVSNFLFIRWMGVAGAALATALTLIARNVLIQWVLVRQYGLYPFSRSMGYVLLAGLLTFTAGMLLPRLPGHFLRDVLVRTTTMVCLYGVLVLRFNLAPDITGLLRTAWGQARHFFTHKTNR